MRKSAMKNHMTKAELTNGRKDGFIASFNGDPRELD